jgi:Plasmid replication region DNA-binding N-term
MMDYPGTRRENEVWKACDDLWALHAAPNKITGDAIRDQLILLGYKKGSPNEIYKFRRSWKNSRGITSLEIGTEPVESPSDPISRAVSLVYEQIQNESQNHLEKMRQDFAENLKKSQQECSTLREAHEKLHTHQQIVDNQLLELQQQHCQLQKQLVEEKNAHALTIQRHQISEELFYQYKADFNLLQAELKNVQEKEIDFWKDKAQKALKEKEQDFLQLQETYKEQWQVFSDEVNQFRVTLRQLHEKNELLLKNYILQQEKVDQLRQELSNTQKKARKHEQETEQIEKLWRALEIKYATARGELAVANKRNIEYKGFWQKLQRELMYRQKNQEKSDVNTAGNTEISAD